MNVGGWQPISSGPQQPASSFQQQHQQQQQQQQPLSARLDQQPWGPNYLMSPAIQNSYRGSSPTPEHSRLVSQSTPRGRIVPAVRRITSYREKLEWQTEIKDAFETFDLQGDGFVDYHALKAAMQALGLPVNKVDLFAAMQEQGCTETGCIDFNAFSNIITQRFKEQDPLDATLNNFKLFDKESRGKISYSDLRRVAQEVGYPVPDPDLWAMIANFDRNHDGEIDEAEFAQIMGSMGLR